MGFIAMILALGFALQAPAQGNSKFTLHISAVKRNPTMCDVVARSERVRFELETNVPANCAVLAAGENYRAYRTVKHNDARDASKDSAVMVIENGGEGQAGGVELDITREEDLGVGKK